MSWLIKTACIHFINHMQTPKMTDMWLGLVVTGICTIDIRIDYCKDSRMDMLLVPVWVMIFSTPHLVPRMANCGRDAQMQGNPNNTEVRSGRLVY